MVYKYVIDDIVFIKELTTRFSSGSIIQVNKVKSNFILIIAHVIDNKLMRYPLDLYFGQKI